MMRHLFVMDPLDRIVVEGDSTYAMMLEAQRRGYPVSMCTPGHLFAEGGESRAVVTPVTIEPGADPFVTGCREERSLGEFDVVWMRKDPPFDMEYIFATYLLDLVPPSTTVLNDPATLRHANEKMYALQWPDLCPPTLTTRDIERARSWAREAPGKVVVKPWDGNGGRGVLVTHGDDGNLRSMLELLTDGERRCCLVQHYIPEIVQGDKRIILINGEPVGWMMRVPQPGDHRGNMHVGATVENFDLSARDKEICDRLAPRLRDEGLLFVGIDIIGDFLTEINVTSPTGFQEINHLMGTRLERLLADTVENRRNG